MADESDSSQPSLEAQRIELERFKARLGYKKFVWGSVFAAITIASIPPSFQYATARLEAMKAEQKLVIDQKNTEAAEAAKHAEFRDNYIRDFFSKGIDQDIELRLRMAQYFKNLANSVEFRQNWKIYYDELKENRDDIRKKIDEMEKKVRQTAVSDTNTADNAELLRHLDWAYKEFGYLRPNRPVAENPREKTPSKDLEAFWMPDGATLNQFNADKIKACMEKNHIPGSAWFLINAGKESDKQLVLTCLGLGRISQTITAVRDTDVARIRADFEASGASVVVTPDGNGTSKIVATYPP